MQTTMDVLRLISLVICLFISVRCEDAVQVKKATSSSVYSNRPEKWGPQLAWKGQSKGNTGYFHSKNEANPWLQIEFTKEERLSSVTIINRISCCGDRLRNVQIRAGIANALVGVFKGPGTSGGVYEIPFKRVVTARFISFQIIGNGILQINGLRFKRAPPVKELYHLAPKGSNTCDYGISALESHCEAAALSLAPNPKRRIQTGSGGRCLDGSWGQVPLGCSAQTGGDNAAHYKTSGDTGAGCIHQAYQLVCTEGPICDESASSLSEFASTEFRRCDELILKHKTMCDDPSIKQACCRTCEG